MLKPLQDFFRRSNNNPTPRKQQNEWPITVIFWCIIVGTTGSILYSSQAVSIAQFLSIAGVAVAVAGAALLAGSLLGFLFGIPKTLQKDSVNDSIQKTEGAKQKNGETIGIQSNTSLEQISDWLTKILLGVGLTQLGSLPESLQKYADFTAPGLGNFANSEVFAIAQLIFYLICGFLISYLWTRLHLAGAFYQAEREFKDEFTQVQSVISELQQQKQQQEYDATALNIAHSQLNPQPNSQVIAYEELDNSIRRASFNIRNQILDEARRIMDEFEKGFSTAINYEKVIPVLKALTASDTDNPNHEYYGFLGTALYLQRHSKPAEAEAELTKAIDARGNSESFGYENWEYWRAICRIEQKKSKEEILADLRVASSSSSLKPYIQKNLTISHWLKSNNISEFDPHIHNRGK